MITPDFFNEITAMGNFVDAVRKNPSVNHIVMTTHAHKGLLQAIDKSIRLSRIIGLAYINQHIDPYSTIEDGLAASVPASSSVDINLKLFEALGRVAIHGLWILQTKAGTPDSANDEYIAAMDFQIQKVLTTICDLINNNPVYNTPLRDDHAIEITLVSLFLIQCKAFDFLNTWIEQILLSSIFAHRSFGKYPCCYREYADLAAHPKHTDEYCTFRLGQLLFRLGYFAIFETKEKLAKLTSIPRKNPFFSMVSALVRSHPQ